MAAWMIPAAIFGSSLLGASSARSAAKSQERAAADSTAAQERMFNKQIELQEPFRKVGVNALPDLVAASKYTPFTMEKFKASPSYSFRLEEGLKALDRSAASRGGLLSGATLKGAQRYGQNLASDEYTNAFNQYQIENAARLNPLQALTGMGVTSANTLTNAAGQLGQNIGANMINAGNARASSYMGTANALAGGLGQYLNYSQGQDLISAYKNSPTGGGLRSVTPFGGIIQG